MLPIAPRDIAQSGCVQMKRAEKAHAKSVWKKCMRGSARAKRAEEIH
ncbi:MULTISPECIES: hypothetical protein [unclassified Helicobacter]|nr:MULTISPECIES: hypothetical protein [unclassified Helicobacter]